MAESDILQHLLAVENEASLLVLEAQREADRRQAESEESARLSYGTRYAQRAAELEKIYLQAEAAARRDYEEEISRYRQVLNAKPVNDERFRVLARGLLFGES
jgi:hypothetical protein